MAAEGRAGVCDAAPTAAGSSVPAAGESPTGVVVPVTTPAAQRDAQPAEPEADEGRSVLATLAWIFAAVGAIALLVAIGLVATGRARLRRDRTAATRTSA